MRSPPDTATALPVRLVLDTNIWLDWLLFHDATVQPVRQAVVEGRAQVVIDAPCLEELQRVLRYPEFKLGPAACADHVAQVRNCAAWQDAATCIGAAPLPRCDDPDDQKFLDLARDARAYWLVTKDKALLRLDHRKLQLPFRIGTPEQCSTHLSDPRLVVTVVPLD